MKYFNEGAIHCVISVLSLIFGFPAIFEIRAHTYGQNEVNLLIHAVLTQVRITHYLQIAIFVSDKTFHSLMFYSLMHHFLKSFILN